MADKTLRSHLLQASEALLGLECSDPSIVMGFPDDLKLRSCMTLFAIAVPECIVFQSVLDKYYGGEMDKKTLKMLRKKWKRLEGFLQNSMSLCPQGSL